MLEQIVDVIQVHTLHENGLSENEGERNLANGENGWSFPAASYFIHKIFVNIGRVS